MSQERILRAKYYHALNLLPSLGPVRIKKLIQHFGTPEQVWKATRQDLLEVKGFTLNLREKILQERQNIHPGKSWDKVLQRGYSFVTWEDSHYPPLLREIYDPPPLLYYCGNIDIVNGYCLAIVGSRRHTVYGREIAYKFASGLSSYGLTVVSGMARGIDTWAHKGTLDAGGKTAAVLGCGLDICYPPENKAVKKKIEDSGVLISEFPPGYRPLPPNFPRRNRIISGLSLGTLVIEAGEKSGALITADFALEQGREVFAIPGGIASPYSRGCHKLIKEGAKLVEKMEDILEELSITVPVKDVSSPQQKQEFNPDERKLLEYIPFEPLALEDLVALSKMPLSLLNALLLELELKGAIKQLPGKYFMKS
ncbi:MAG: DNA-processing protein DprA [Dethiobacteria bacterium]